MSETPPQPMNAHEALAQTQQVAIGEAVINPPWQGHLIALSDNGGDLLMLSFNHPRHGQIRILYPRAVGAGIRDWLNVALQAPMLRPEPPAQPQPAIEQPPAGTA